MQWNQIKTLFILCFLILDVYLLYQFIDKQDRANPEQFNYQEQTLEDKLAAESIKISDKEVDITEDSVIKVSPKKLTDTEMERIAGLSNQDPQIINNYTVVSRFKEPVSIPKQASEMSISQLVKSYVAFSDEFSYWGWNKDTNVLIFFQNKNNRPIYYNQYGLLLVYLNDANEMMYYTQTLLGEAEPQGEKLTLIKVNTMFNELYKENKLYSNDEIVNIENGYYTRIKRDTGAHVFAPTYLVSIKDAEDNIRNYFFNAVESYIYPSDDTSFITSTITDSLPLYKQINDEVEWKTGFIDYLNQLVDDNKNRSEQE